MTPKDVIIDTDPGVDDALALMLALRSPELRVRAITAVAGNVMAEIALANAGSIINLVEPNSAIPLGRGAAAPLCRPLRTATHVHGENGLAGLLLPRPVRYETQDAVRLMLETARRYPGCTIIALGPLTNVAHALAAGGSSLRDHAAQLMIMGGSFSGGNVTPEAEFNFHVDPEAAQAVFASGLPIAMVGLDVTRTMLLRDEHVVALGASADKVARVAAQLVSAQRSLWPSAAVHDAVAVAAAFAGDQFTTEKYWVRVEGGDENAAGRSDGWTEHSWRQAHPDRPWIANAEVAMNANCSEFFKLLLGRLGAAGY